MSVETDQVYCSNNGEIWVAYSSAPFLSKFDGIKWKQFDLESLNLPLNLIIVRENQDGIWLYSHSHKNHLIRYDNAGEWHSYKFEVDFKFCFNPETQNPIVMGKDFISHEFDIKTNQFHPQIKQLINFDIDVPLKDIYLSNITPSEIIVTIYRADESVEVKRGNDFSSSYTYSDKKGENLIGHSSYSIQLKDGTPIIVKEEVFNPIKIIAPSNSPVKFVKLIYLHSNSAVNSEELIPYYFLFETISDKKLHLYQSDFYGNTKLILEDVPADIGKNMTRDHFGRLWICTSSGVCKIDPSQLSFNENRSEMVKGLHVINEDNKGQIWFGGYHSMMLFSRYDGFRLKSQTSSGPVKLHGLLPGTYKDRSGHLYFFSEVSGLVGFNQGRTHEVVLKGHIKPLVGYIFQPLKNDFVALGLLNEGLAIAKLYNFTIDSLRIIGKEKGLKLQNVITLAQDKNERIWMGRTSQGIAVYDPIKDTIFNWMREDYPENGLGALCLNIDENNILWMGTQKGLFCLKDVHLFNIEQNNLFDFAEEFQLPGDPMSTPGFLLNEDKYLIVGTRRAVHFIDKKYNGKRPRVFSLKFGKDLDGSEAEQNAVLKDSKGYLWIGAQTGATRLDLNNLPFDTSETIVMLEYFKADDTEIKLSGNYIGKIPLNKRHLEIGFTASGNPMLHDNLIFDIFLIQSNGDTILQKLNHTDLNFIFEYLPPDSYKLQIVAYKNNVESCNVGYAFVIPAQLTERPLFWILLAILIVTIPGIWLWANSRHKQALLKQQVRLEQSKRERDELKVLALANFFNPHFINNSLHWIQSKYRKDPDTALIIQRLAENVNILFHNSNKGKAYHALGNEMELVKNYLGIQQIRFDMEFDISIEVPLDNDSWKLVYIPSMLLQIHTENAIEKGIRQRKAANCFKTRIKNFPEHLEIYLEDDGIGRKNQQSDKVVLTRKGSTDVMQDLIDVLNQYNKTKLSIQYIDNIFTDELGTPYGTGILIILPKTFIYDIS